MSFSLTGIEYPGISALVDFSYDSSGTVNIDITNNSEPALGGAWLTGFGFNAPEAVTGVGFFTGPGGWAADFNSNGIESAQKIGLFDVAAMTGPKVIGGNPNFGIDIGSSGAFRFTLTGKDAIFGLDQSAFLSLLSETRKGNYFPQYFFARFQRVGADDGSDIAIPGSINPVPEPATMLLLGTGLTGLAGLGRRKLKQK